MCQMFVKFFELFWSPFPFWSEVSDFFFGGGGAVGFDLIWFWFGACTGNKHHPVCQFPENEACCVCLSLVCTFVASPPPPPSSPSLSLSSLSLNLTSAIDGKKNDYDDDKNLINIWKKKKNSKSQI